MIYFVAAVAAISGFLFGFDEGVIAGALPLLDKQFDASTVMSGLMTAAVPLGALIGCLLAGRITDRYGRRRVLLASAVLFALGSLAAASAMVTEMLLVARFFLGFGIGIAAVVAPLYISETAPARIRGTLISAFQLAITIGILSSYLIGYAFVQSESWRMMFASGIVPALCLFVGVLFLPESPRWLAMRGQNDKARTSLERLRDGKAESGAITQELDEISSTLEQEDKKADWRELFTPLVRPALIVGMGLFFLQQLSGINAVIYYAPRIFSLSGFGSATTQLLATIGIGVANVAFTVLAMYLIDRIGRRRLLVIGFIGTTISLGVISLAASTEIAWLDWLSVGGLIVFIASFAVSLGPLPYVMMSEVFPANIRSQGMAFASVSNWGFGFIVVFSFPSLLAGIGLGGTFLIFSVICALGIIFTLRYVPETKGVSLEEIERHVLSGKPLVELGR